MEGCLTNEFIKFLLNFSYELLVGVFLNHKVWSINHSWLHLRFDFRKWAYIEAHLFMYRFEFSCVASNILWYNGSRDGCVVKRRVSITFSLCLILVIINFVKLNFLLSVCLFLLFFFLGWGLDVLLSVEIINLENSINFGSFRKCITEFGDCNCFSRFLNKKFIDCHFFYLRFFYRKVRAYFYVVIK